MGWEPEQPLDDIERRIAARAFRPKRPVTVSPLFQCRPSGGAPEESPADEYERRLAERRNEAAPAIMASLVIWVILHGAAFVFGLSVPVLGLGMAIPVVLLWVASLVQAVLALPALARHWSVLSVRQRAAGAVPAAVMLAEMSLPAIFLTLRSVL